MKKTLYLGMVIAGTVALAQPGFAQSAAEAAREAKGDSGKDRLEKQGISDVLDLLKESFQAKADEHQTKQKELLDAIKIAKGEERKKLRDQLKDLQEVIKEAKDKFKDQVKDLNEKLRDQAAKLKEETKQSREDRKGRGR